MDFRLESAVVKASTGEWAALKQQLEKCPPFSDTLSCVSQDEWLRNRKELLTKLINLCPSDHRRSVLIDAFRKCIGEGHFLTKALKEHLQPSVGDGRATQGYGTMLDIQQFQRQKGIAKHSFCWTKTFCGTASALSLIVALVTITMVMYMLLAPCQKHSPTLGVNDDTVLLGNPITPRDSHLAISECLQSGDYYHRSDIFVVSTSDLIIHERNDQWSSRVLEQPRPSVLTGVVEYLYLVEGSNISYELCTTNEAYSDQQGTFYIFDNRDDYFTYVNQLNNPGEKAVFSHHFTLAANNLTTCLKINYTVSQSSYYFLAATTPGGIRYSYSYDIATRYYNHTDYTTHCSVLDTTTCDISLPFDFKQYTVLAYIHPLANSDPFATHVCLKTGWTKAARVQVSVIGATTVLVFLLLFVMTLIYLTHLCCCSYGYRNGYARIGAE